MIVEFKLTDNTSAEIVFKSHKLVEVWNYIRTTINEPHSYSVEEYDGDNCIDIISAYYFIENFKEEKSVPLTVTQIH